MVAGPHEEMKLFSLLGCSGGLSGSGSELPECCNGGPLDPVQFHKQTEKMSKGWILLFHSKTMGAQTQCFVTHPHTTGCELRPEGTQCSASGAAAAAAAKYKQLANLLKRPQRDPARCQMDRPLLSQPSTTARTWRCEQQRRVKKHEISCLVTERTCPAPAHASK